MKPDAIIKVRFKTAAEGGRQGPIISGETMYYRCLLLVDGQAFGAEVLGDQRIEPGNTYELPIRFVVPVLALQKLSPGKPVTLSEGKNVVAKGEVLHLP
jgi:hypothetical protein